MKGELFKILMTYQIRLEGMPVPIVQTLKNVT